MDAYKGLHIQELTTTVNLKENGEPNLHFPLRIRATGRILDPNNDPYKIEVAFEFETRAFLNMTPHEVQQKLAAHLHQILGQPTDLSP